MASFPVLRSSDPSDLPSDSTEGVRLFRKTKLAAAAALLLAAVNTASAPLELATLQGRRAVRSTLDLLTRALGASLHPASPVGAPAAARGPA
jgi:hypothetical protein